MQGEFVFFGFFLYSSLHLSSSMCFVLAAGNCDLKLVTPAMEAGITKNIWNWEDLLYYEEMRMTA